MQEAGSLLGKCKCSPPPCFHIEIGLGCSFSSFLNYNMVNTTRITLGCCCCSATFTVLLLEYFSTFPICMKGTAFLLSFFFFLKKKPTGPDSRRTQNETNLIAFYFHLLAHAIRYYLLSIFRSLTFVGGFYYTFQFLITTYILSIREKSQMQQT